MGFITIPGFPGKIFVPEAEPDRNKKHPCADCFSCQWCDADRCALCRARTIARRPRPPQSSEEQAE